MSFGETLRRERELRGISLHEIAEATKISVRFLQALEQDLDIPPGIFPRAFVAVRPPHRADAERWLPIPVPSQRAPWAAGPRGSAGRRAGGDLPRARGRAALLLTLRRPGRAGRAVRADPPRPLRPGGRVDRRRAQARHHSRFRLPKVCVTLTAQQVLVGVRARGDRVQPGAKRGETETLARPGVARPVVATRAASPSVSTTAPAPLGRSGEVRKTSYRQGQDPLPRAGRRDRPGVAQQLKSWLKPGSRTPSSSSFARAGSRRSSGSWRPRPRCLSSPRTFSSS